MQNKPVVRLGNYLEIVLVFKDAKAYKLNINKHNATLEFPLSHKKKFAGHEMSLPGRSFLSRDWYVGIHFPVKFACSDRPDTAEETLNSDWKSCSGPF